ncbi:(2Fe-2S)-binding protein [candidate division KSB1 bacterium]|nr:(2Fe-2S)-binding protein [candidate division KSB1 bacterium]
MPKVIIDGKTVEVKTGATILDAAKKLGIWIPTLCYHPALSHSATCRLCMVELDRGDWKQLVTSCNYPVRRDITVSVSSDAAVKARRGVMELLLARAPESEELKELGKKMGVEGTPYPNVTESQRNCILCGLCTTVCEEVIGQSAIGFAGRGVDRCVAAPFRQASEDCIGCGACAVVCPVGTIQIRIHDDTSEVEISPFKSRVKLLACESCGKSLITEPVAMKMLSKVNIDWEEFRTRARLCPECRRRKTAQALAIGSTESH